MKWDLTTQLFYGGQWNDAPAYVRDPVEITRGREDEQPGAVPSKSTATLDNRTGDYNPTYPLSPLYGLAGRNTPVRHVLSGLSFLRTVAQADYASTPDDASLDITGDIDVRVEVRLVDWTDSGLAEKYVTTGNQRSWAWYINGADQMVFRWTADGVVHSESFYGGALPMVDGQRVALRVTMDVDNGAGGKNISFYWAPSIAGPWTLLVSNTTAITTSVFSSTAPVEVGRAFLGTAASDGRFYAFELYSGIAGTLVANPRFDQTTATDPFTDSIGRTWTVQGGALFVPNSVRHAAEIAKWAPDRSIDFNGVKGDAWTGVDAAGILRRLGQGDPPAESALFRQIRGLAGLVAYWPMEDGSDAIRFASGLLGGSTMTIVQQGGVDLAADDSLPGSAALPKTVRNLDVNSSMIARAPLSGIANTLTVGFWVQIPDLGSVTTDFGQGIRITITYAGGDVPSMVIRVFYDPSTQDDFLYIESPDGALGMPPTTATHSQQWRWIRASIEQSGSSLRSRLWADEVSIGDVSDASITLGRPVSIEVGIDAGSGTPNRKPDVLPISTGHVAVLAGVVTPANMLQAGAGWAGETAADRFLRLCAEENIPASLVGVAADTPPMGPQPVDTLTNLFAECERTDAGMLYEQRSALGLAYRTRVDLFNQAPALTLDWNAGQVAPPLLPALDDQKVRNDITAKRANGSSARAVRDTGPLNVNRPEDDAQGVGRYATKVDVNPQSDLDLPDLAHWYLNLGTIEDVRFPRVTVDLDASPELAEDASLVDIGDLIAINNVPVDLAADQLRLIVVGYGEPVGSHRRLLTFNTVPATAWQVGVYDQDRYESSGTVRETNPISDVQTAITFTITGPMWVTNPARFPFPGFIGGEKVTVTAISAPSGNLQTFTVTRSVNGIVKAHPVGTKFRLARQARYA